MKIISTYNRKWLTYSVVFFIFFAFILLVFEYRHEKGIRINALNTRLKDYSLIVNNYIRENRIFEEQRIERIDSLVELLLDPGLRITVIGTGGTVLYDSGVEDVKSMENHLHRPEIQQALAEGTGTGIRLSETTNIKYYYFAGFYENYFVRTSVIYDISVRDFLKPDLLFLIFVIFILFISSATIIFISDKFGESVSSLRQFTNDVLENKPVNPDMNFPKNELGDIGKKIIEIYRNLNNAKEELIKERAKLIRHLNIADDGIAVFSADRKLITKNNHFIIYLNHISDTRIYSPEQVLEVHEFRPLKNFIESQAGDAGGKKITLPRTYEISIKKGGKHFIVTALIFEDQSFEISINDVTKFAKRKIIKQELTENIAHELKTPVSSIRGLLETILEGNPDPQKAKDFLQRAYAQSRRLTELIDDISLLTKIEEAGKLYKIEEVNLNATVAGIIQELQAEIEENKISLNVRLGDDLVVRGNQVLIYSIFRNLVDNAINHAGKGVTVNIEKFLEDSDNYYFTFTDNGHGVPEQDLPRLFERFYRVDKGRDRKKGGTGLGLSIVNNAVKFHKGTISVKNGPGGGLQFMFTISKSL